RAATTPSLLSLENNAAPKPHAAALSLQLLRSPSHGRAQVPTCGRHTSASVACQPETAMAQVNNDESHGPAPHRPRVVSSCSAGKSNLPRHPISPHLNAWRAPTGVGGLDKLVISRTAPMPSLFSLPLLVKPTIHLHSCGAYETIRIITR
ncbi:hypothetical protein HAX54_015517, partial [Datura stramonium]|nr:hypothetical protein [Datura stramonium]